MKTLIYLTIQIFFVCLDQNWLNTYWAIVSLDLGIFFKQTGVVSAIFGSFKKVAISMLSLKIWLRYQRAMIIYFIYARMSVCVQDFFESRFSSYFSYKCKRKFFQIFYSFLTLQYLDDYNTFLLLLTHFRPMFPFYTT